MESHPLQNLDSAIRRFIVFTLTLYQRTFSPDHSVLGKAMHPFGYCRFYPSCSSYAKTAFQEKNLMRAAFIVAKRIVRCNPWSQGGFDYPPHHKSTKAL